MLGYGVSAISAPLTAFQDALSRNIAGLTHGRQITTRSQVEVGKEGDDCQVIAPDEEGKVRNYTDWEKSFKVLEQQITEIKTRMESYEQQGRIFKMKSKIPIRISNTETDRVLPEIDLPEIIKPTYP